MTRDKVGELAFQLEVRLRGRAMETQQVDSLRHKRHLRLVVEVHTPYRVGNRLITIIHLLGDGTLTQMQRSSADIEVLVKSIVEVEAKHALVGQRDGGTVLQRNGDRRT